MRGLKGYTTMHLLLVLPGLAILPCGPSVALKPVIREEKSLLQENFFFCLVNLHCVTVDQINYIIVVSTSFGIVWKPSPAA